MKKADSCDKIRGHMLAYRHCESPSMGLKVSGFGVMPEVRMGRNLEAVTSDNMIACDSGRLSIIHPGAEPWELCRGPETLTQRVLSPVDDLRSAGFGGQTSLLVL